jgi:chromosome segregation ATPase
MAILPTMAETWEKAMSEYETKNFQQAAASFREIFKENTKDGTAKLYAEGCEKLLKHPRLRTGTGSLT